MSFIDECNSGNPIIKPSKKDKKINTILLIILLVIILAIGFFMYF